jgi:protein-S-isoprenylcysteine O-methyltransferase Ste14
VGVPETASILAIIWFLTAFALRIGIHVHRHDDTGIRANAGPPFSLGWWARLLFTASTVVVATGPALAAGDLVQPVPVLDRGVIGWAGLILAATGMALTFWAQLAMGASWRIGVDPSERTALVTTGPFAVVRNPIFTTMALTGLGLTLMSPTVVGLSGLLGLIASLEVQVRAVEEPYLKKVHDAAYTTYAAQTGRFLPRPNQRSA